MIIIAEILKTLVNVYKDYLINFFLYIHIFLYIYISIAYHMIWRIFVREKYGVYSDIEHSNIKKQYKIYIKNNSIFLHIIQNKMYLEVI